MDARELTDGSSAAPLRRRGATFKRPRIFWLGVASITSGVLLHLPMFFSARDDGYMLRDMPWDRWMILGMGLVAFGYAAVFYGLAPRFKRGEDAAADELEFKALDSVRMGPAHLKLLAALMIAIAVDTQKPFTFTFILGGVAGEYNLDSPAHPAPDRLPVALFPFVAITGTVVGSILWGYLGDRIGRRASILLAATIFIGTSMCAAMPAFHYNLIACFFMGASAGGLLPIAYSLLTEVIPVRRRGEVVALVAGIGTALGFLLASWTANWLIPDYGWRIMWFFGVPTGLALIILNRWIPESPRFLLANGRRSEAHEVMTSFGIDVTRKPSESEAPAPLEPREGMARVFRRPYRGITLALVVYGLAWGLANFGFLVWLPLNVAEDGITVGTVTSILAKAALFSIPGCVLVAWLYGRWSSKWTLIAAATATAGALGVFALAGDTIVRHTNVFTALVVVLLIAMWATISVLAPYSAEVYPTRIRAGGAGVVAGASKLGGVFALGISVAALAPPDIAGAALMAALPAALAAAMLVAFGIETRGRRLEEIRLAELEPVTAET